MTAIYAAPLQGYTDAAWREAHRAVYGGAMAAYFAPFARVERGEVRARDLRDVAPEALAAPTVPQAIFRDAGELRVIIEALRRQGHGRVDLNMGCPFPPQVKHGRGAGILARRDALADVADYVKATTDIRFSVKMRLGTVDTDEWRGVVEIIAGMPLEHVAIHPRVAAQQYKGGLHTDQFAALAAVLPQPVVFNGDVRSRSDIERALSMPHVAGVMIGRGLQARPSLAAEWSEGREWSTAERLQAIARLHELTFARRAARLSGGEAQLVEAMHPFWEYLEEEIGRKAAKAIRKSRTLAAYEAAVAAAL